MTAPADAGRFRGPTGHLLHFRAWPAVDPRAALLVAHGLGEHSGRYAPLAAALVERGVSVLALDHQGHGSSDGVRGHVDRFDDFVADLEAFRERASPPGLPVFLLGHSLGGLIATRYLETHPGAPLRGAVLSAPALGLDLRPPLWKRALARVLERVAPALPIPNEVDPLLLSHDPEMVEAYRVDPLVHGKVTPRLYHEILRAMERAIAERDRIRVPSLLVIVPGEDRIVSPGATLDFAAALPGEVTVRRYPEMYHEALNERGRDRVIDDLLGWLLARIP